MGWLGIFNRVPVHLSFAVKSLWGPISRFGTTLAADGCALKLQSMPATSGAPAGHFAELPGRSAWGFGGRVDAVPARRDGVHASQGGFGGVSATP